MKVWISLARYLDDQVDFNILSLSDFLLSINQRFRRKSDRLLVYHFAESRMIARQISETTTTPKISRSEYPSTNRCNFQSFKINRFLKFRFFIVQLSLSKEQGEAIGIDHSPVTIDVVVPLIAIRFSRCFLHEKLKKIKGRWLS